MRTRLLFFVLLGFSCLVGCSHLGAKPYERGILSKPTMAIDSDPTTTGFNNHTYFSKEASSGGASFGGGGCGCN